MKKKPTKKNLVVLLSSWLNQSVLRCQFRIQQKAKQTI